MDHPREVPGQMSDPHPIGETTGGIRILIHEQDLHKVDQIQGIMVL
jgi:hypothetical protein